MPQGDIIFRDWRAQVEPRVQYIRDAFLAWATLEELKTDAEGVQSLWQSRIGVGSVALQQDAKSQLEAAKSVCETYSKAWQDMSAQMERVAAELDKFQDQRLTLTAMCRTLNIQEIGNDVLEKVYQVVGPDTEIDKALSAAKSIVSDLDAETKARQELKSFLAHG